MSCLPICVPRADFSKISESIQTYNRLQSYFKHLCNIGACRLNIATPNDDCKTSVRFSRSLPVGEVMCYTIILCLDICPSHTCKDNYGRIIPKTGSIWVIHGNDMGRYLSTSYIKKALYLTVSKK
jgi:hypothetical protein